MKTPLIKKLFVLVLIGQTVYLPANTLNLKPDLDKPAEKVSERKPNPWLTGAFGAVVPGAGYLTTGSTGKAALAFLTLPGMFGAMVNSPPTAGGQMFNTSLYLASRNLYGFSVYDSFQEALDLNGRPKLLVNNARYDFGTMMLAPFQSRLYEPKKVWIPLLTIGGILALGVTAARQSPSAPELTADKLLLGIPLIALSCLTIGAGEESDFRGFYYPALSELTGSAVLGAVMQGLLFGYMHTSWYLRGFPMLSGGVFTEVLRESPPTNDLTKFIGTSILGMHMAWITSSEEEGLLNSIAFHATWDFLILTGLLLMTNEAPPVVLSFRL